MIVPFDQPPLDPSSPQAQQWARDELTHGRYDTSVPWWRQLLDWLTSHTAGGHTTGMPAWAAPLVVVLVLAAVGLIVALVLRREGGRRRTRGARSAGLSEEGLRADDYRRRARAAEALGDWDAVLLDSYRAVAAAAVERTLLDELPGRTAHEAAVALGPLFPEHRDALEATAAAFDAVRYGHLSASSDQARRAAELDQAVLRSRPQLPAGGAR
ncbi:MAG: DUF4129 domain-containing protein [Oryzihumus sp.]